jgi:alpha-beta hydrolase superfamily lysophospholipase
MRNLPPATFRSTDGLTLAYRTDDFTDPWREPQTVVLLHSMMGSSERFYRWVPTLPRASGWCVRTCAAMAPQTCRRPTRSSVSSGW